MKNLYSRSMIDKIKKLIVLMPPKTASNSVRVLLNQLGYLFKKNQIQTSPQVHLKLDEIVKQYDVTDLSSYKIIQVVRNPYHRFVSSFFFQKKIIPSNFTVNFRDYTLEEFSNLLLLSKKSNDFIKNFYGDDSYVNYCIQNGISWGGTRFYDSQIGWNNLGVKVNYFKLEDLSSNVCKLEDFLNTSIDKLPILNSQSLNFDYLSLITPTVKDIVVELFREDFDNLGYKK